MDLTEDEFVALEEYFGKDLDGHQPDEGTDSEVDGDDTIWEDDLGFAR